MEMTTDPPISRSMGVINLDEEANGNRKNLTTIDLVQLFIFMDEIEFHGTDHDREMWFHLLQEKIEAHLGSYICADRYENNEGYDEDDEEEGIK